MSADDRNYPSRRTTRLLHVFVQSLVLLAVPAAAYANIVFPSVVQWLSAAGPYSLCVLPAVLTVPLLLAISIIEALIVRQFIKTSASATQLIIVLFVINALTSAVGLVTMPNGTELQGLPLAFLATAVIEGFCLVVVHPQGHRRLSAKLFKASAAMNGASYTFLGGILFLLIYLPSARMPNDLNKAELSGQIVIVNYHGQSEAVISPSNGEVLRYPVQGIAADEPAYKVGFINGKRWMIDTASNKRIGIIPGDSYRGDWQVSDNGRYYANCLANSDVGVVGDIKKGWQKKFRNVDQLTLCRKTGKAAMLTEGELTIYDPAQDKIAHLPLYGTLKPFTAIAWSPDGNYIAHTAITSPFTQMIGSMSPDAIRVVALDGRQTTILRDTDAKILASEMHWLPQ